jgi:hypothetical protein
MKTKRRINNMSIFNNKKNEKANMPSVRIERIDVTKLHAQLYFQNPPNEARVNAIVDNFDWNLFQPLDVSFRDDKYNVVDGQNRLYAVLKKFKNSGKIINVPCLTRYGLTESEEMELFVDLAQMRRKVQPIEIYKALYGSGNQLIVDMVDITRKVGFLFDFKNSKANGRITAVKTLHNIYSQLGKTDYEKFLKLLYLTWNGESRSLQQEMLLGLFEFYKVYVLDIDEKTFINRLGKMSTDEIYRLGGRNSKRVMGIAYTILEQYNKGAKKNRLDERIF